MKVFNTNEYDMILRALMLHVFAIRLSPTSEDSLEEHLWGLYKKIEKLKKGKTK